MFRGKARIRAYVDLHEGQVKSLATDDLFDLLDANRSRYGRSIDDPAFRRQLNDEFEKYKRFLTDLYGQSATIDEAMDRAVCRLYAFSETQIERINAAQLED